MVDLVFCRLKWKGDDLDPHFRLWLSCKSDPVFPASILQRGFKVRLWFRPSSEISLFAVTSKSDIQ